jgi:hypothetical protein
MPGEEAVSLRDVVQVTVTAVTSIFAAVLLISPLKRRARKFARRQATSAAKRD